MECKPSWCETSWCETALRYLVSPIFILTNQTFYIIASGIDLDWSNVLRIEKNYYLLANYYYLSAVPNLNLVEGNIVLQNTLVGISSYFVNYS